ncbi:MAG: GAF domain-containing protein [Deltaproteobacteria bacterium]|nr:GAF domain-containing protein [Deltaproteobacteria bacterium]
MFTRMMDNATDTLLVADSTLRCLAASKSISRMLGYSPEEFLKMDISTRIHPEDMLHQPVEMAETRPGKACSTERRLQKKDGTYVETEIHCSPLGVDGLLFMFIREITRRKAEGAELARVTRALKALSESNKAVARIHHERDLMEEICRIVVEVGGYRLAWAGLVLYDENKTIQPMAQCGYEDGYLETINLTWADTERGRGPTGRAVRTKKYVLAQNVFTDPDFEPWRQQAIRRGYGSAVSIPLTVDNRPLGTLNIYAGPVDAFSQEELNLLQELSDNLSLGLHALRLDEEHRNTEMQILRVQKMEALGNLTQSLAHYFNNGLTIILGNLELLTDRLTDEKLKRLAQAAHNSALKSASLTKQLLDFSRRSIEKPKSIKLNSLIEDMIPLLTPSLDGITLTTELAPDLWPTLLDPLAAENMLIHLITNARDVQPQGGGIRVSTANRAQTSGNNAGPLKAGDYVVVEVADDGPGMDTEVLAHCFDPFFTTKGVAGTGMGLSMVYGLAQQAGGLAEADSSPGNGTRIKIWFPRLLG